MTAACDITWKWLVMDKKVILCVSEFQEPYSTALKLCHDLGSKTIAVTNQNWM